jgi:outer membrane PBP1 activator LpoA protein
VVLRVLRVAVFVLAGAVAASCAGPRASPTAVAVCASLPLSGAAQTTGEAMRRGYERAVAEVNRAGGLRWRGASGPLPVTIDIRDDRGHAAEVEAAAEALLSAGCSAMLGTASPIRMAVQVAVTERRQKPLFLDVRDTPGFPPTRARWTVPVVADGDPEGRAHAVASVALRALRAARRTDASVLRDTALQLVAARPGTASH